MHCVVRPLRLRARRLPWTLVVKGPIHGGDLIACEMRSRSGRVYKATLLSTDPAVPQRLSDLYEPVMTGMATVAFALRGFERHDGPDGPYSVARGMALSIDQIVSSRKAVDEHARNASPEVHSETGTGCPAFEGTEGGSYGRG